MHHQTKRILSSLCIFAFLAPSGTVVAGGPPSASPAFQRQKSQRRGLLKNFIRSKSVQDREQKLRNIQKTTEAVIKIISQIQGLVTKGQSIQATARGMNGSTATPQPSNSTPPRTSTPPTSPPGTTSPKQSRIAALKLQQSALIQQLQVANQQGKSGLVRILLGQLVKVRAELKKLTGS